MINFNAPEYEDLVFKKSELSREIRDMAIYLQALQERIVKVYKREVRNGTRAESDC